jgi:type I restriction enzyme S subunit
MSAEWKNMQLGDFIELKRGYDLPKKNRETGIVPLVSSAGESDFHSEAKVKGPGVVTGRYGTIGQVFYIETDFWPLNTTLYVKDFKGNNPLFVYYFLKTISYSDYSDKAAVPGINRNHLHQAEVKVPVDLKNQHNIAKVLGVLDAKIQLNRQINQTLEAMAQAIFQSWFVDFDPVKAKIAAREQWQTLSDGERSEWLNDIVSKQAYLKTCLSELTANGEQSASETLYLNIAAMTAISSRDETSLADISAEEFAELYKTASLFPERLVDSELGEIPEGWSVGCIGDIAKAKGGYAFKGSSFSSNGNPVVKIKNITGDGRVDINGAVCIDDDLANSSNRFKLCDGDLLMAMTGATVGKIGFVITEGKSVYLNQRVAKFESDRFGRKISQFLFCCFERESIFSLVVGAAHGSAQPNISSSGIESVSLILPVDELIGIFCDKTNFIFKEWINNLSGNSILEEIRDAVLPKLLSGELALTDKVENLGGLFDRL